MFLLFAGTLNIMTLLVTVKLSISLTDTHTHIQLMKVIWVLQYCVGRVVAVAMSCLSCSKFKPVHCLAFAMSAPAVP